MKNYYQTIGTWLAIFVLIIGQALFVAFNYISFLGLILIILLVSRIAVLSRRPKFSPKVQLVVSLAMILIVLVAMIMDRIIVTNLTGLVISLAVFYLFWTDLKTRRLYFKKSPTITSRLVSLGGYILLIAGILNLFFLTWNLFGYNHYAKNSQGNELSRIYHPGKPKQFVTTEGYYKYKNITYPSKTKGNQLDITRVPQNKGTVFWIHGGGFVAGDKDTQIPYLRALNKKGYNTVNINYSLAPQTPYPTQLIQANSAFSFIAHHANQFGLNINKLVLAGDSAGGTLAGQLANIYTNPRYAKNYPKKIKVFPTTTENGRKVKISGIILNCALSDTPRFARTGSPFADWEFNMWGKATFNNLDYPNTYTAHESSVLSHVTRDFPQSYITDGNTGTFTKQNQDLVQKLKSLHVKVNSNFYSRKQAKLPHEYNLNLTNYYGGNNFHKTVKFLNQLPN